MKNTRLLSIQLLFSVVFFGFLLCSCSGNDDDPEPEDDDDTIKLNAPDGVELRLEWKSGGSFSKGIDEAELDLLLFKDGSQVGTSAGLNSLSKRVNVGSHFVNGTYELRIDYERMDVQSVRYNLIITGENEIYSLTGTYDAPEVSDEEAQHLNTELVVLRIQKSGDEYRLVDDF